MAKRLIEENDELAKLLSHTLRMIFPHEYDKWIEVSEMMKKKEGLEGLFKAWCGVALNEGMTREGGKVHKDAQDYGVNCTVPLGEITCGNMVLMELVKKVEVRASDAFFFWGEYIAHKREAVQGVRGLADFFPHKNVLDLCDKEKSRKRRHKKEEFRKKNK